MQADIVVKSVMLLLVIASVACWAFIFEKMIKIPVLKMDMRRLENFADSGRIDQRPSCLAGEVIGSMANEAAIHDSDESDLDRRARIEREGRLALKAGLRRAEFGLPMLATVGSAAPFIGLFGTVWGIVNSFTAIAQQKDTSLAVVAPGIAEALIATALGLAAAIPAVFAYNQIAVSFGRIFARGDAAIIAIAKLLVRGEQLHIAAPTPLKKRVG
jgi:biopolymer transport protein ExbB/TolQ